MNVIVLCEFADDIAASRSRLFDRLAPMLLRGEARLSFAASEVARPDSERPGSERPGSKRHGLVAIGFGTLALAEAFVLRWRDDLKADQTTTMRLLNVEPIWQSQPWPLMFP